MATNLRLRADAEAAVRAAAQRTGRSQQDVLRAAVDSYLGLDEATAPRSDREVLIATGTVRPARTPFRAEQPKLTLPAGTDTTDLLGREDRI